LEIIANFLSFASGQEVIRKATGQVAKVVRPRKQAQKLGSKETAWNLGTSPKVSQSLWFLFCFTCYPNCLDTGGRE
jgi:hypothetical protein